MNSKWRIKGLDTHVVGEDGNIYRLPYTKGFRSYNTREIKMQYPERWIINGTAWSKSQLRLLLYKDESPIELKKDCQMPF
tara:strand:- start:3320 stop:3559 length:240 start_codon:yes stop_codon:yes gene_type:complete